MTAATILIIEDDAAILRALKDHFAAKGFHVLTARDGEEGLDKALTQPIEVILLDIMLPLVNGFELCRAVRAEGREMPIVMLTAKGQEEDIIRGLELGADDYLTKPFSIRELHARVQALLRRHHTDTPAAYEFGDCRLDTVSRRLFRANAEVTLTTKEFRLLEYFLQRPSRALTRDTIMVGVWGSEVLVTARSVDRCVTTLRSKIESAPHAPTMIQTIREVGYRFEPGTASRA
ncbi:MAG: two component transcriptional regulator, winged helix family [Chthoniobacter sp.]|jgi:DNA-binding response OmpR family regulator|nr:two component transcriptional regulator, winged helix family [Chthoniobacter sp.]